MGGRIKNIAVPGMKFGKGIVIDPEVKVTEAANAQRRYARMRCDKSLGGCGAVYLAALTNLFAGRTRGCPACARKRPRRPGGRVRTCKSGFAVEVYAGYYPTRRLAEEAAARARVVFLPEVPPKAL